jgi:predicted nucleic acid-binding protein
MTVVIADTSPINYLVLINEIDVLSRLYRQIVIPEEVAAELVDDDAPPSVRIWMKQRREWIEIRSSPKPDPDLMELDAGEAAAISLAEAETDVLLLIDEMAGRQEATRRGIPNTGTLGILRRAAIERLIDLPSALELLQATNFRVSKPLLEELLAEDAERARHLS